MFFAILCDDNANSLHVRLETRAAHLEYLGGFEGRVKFAGPQLAADGETPIGSLIIIEAEDMQDAERFAHNDPYAKAGLFKTSTIRSIRPVLGEWLPKNP